jgi:hypothetical protein
MHFRRSALDEFVLKFVEWPMVYLLMVVADLGCPTPKPFFDPLQHL